MKEYLRKSQLKKLGLNFIKKINKLRRGWDGEENIIIIRICKVKK